jgi:hypothetical protein
LILERRGWITLISKNYSYTTMKYALGIVSDKSGVSCVKNNKDENIAKEVTNFTI